MEPSKCEAARRALIRVTDLADMEKLSGETEIVFKRFIPEQWVWLVAVTHDVLPLISPITHAVTYDSVYAFNKMVESKIAAAIAGTPAEEDPNEVAQRHAWQKLVAYYHQQQQQQAALQQQAYGLQWAQQGNTGSLSSLGQVAGSTTTGPLGGSTLAQKLFGGGTTATSSSTNNTP